MQHNVQNRAGDVGCPVGSGCPGADLQPFVSVAVMPHPPDLPASPNDPLPLYIAKLRQRKSVCMSRSAGEKR